MRFQIVLFALMAGVLAESPSVTVTLGTKGHCGKYVQDVGYLQIAGIKLVVVDSNHKITKVIACTMSKQESAETVRGTCGGKWKANANTKVILSVRINLKGRYVTNDIEYRYNENVMKMLKMGTYDPISTQDKPFNAQAHLFVSEIRMFDGSQSTVYTTGSDSCFSSWPNFLIADHGLYTYVSKSKGLARVYFDPNMPNEYFLPE